MAVVGWALAFGTARRGLTSLKERQTKTVHQSAVGVPTALLYNDPLLCDLNVFLKS